MPTELRDAEIRHRMPGRLRLLLTVPAPPAVLDDLAAALARLPDVQEAEARPHSQSLIVHHQADLPDSALLEAGLRIVTSRAPATKPAPWPDPINLVGEQLARADRAVSMASNGRIDLWGIAFTGAIVGGVVQLTRGVVAMPALAMFGQAVTIAMARSLRGFMR